MSDKLTIGKAVHLSDKPQIRATVRTSLPQSPTPRRTSAMELAKDLFHEACMTSDGKYDHRFISTYEQAQQQLIEWGMIKAEDCLYARK